MATLRGHALNPDDLAFVHSEGRSHGDSTEDCLADFAGRPMGILVSARMLLDEVRADHLVFDFTGVMDVGDEFLEELLAKAHPDTHLEAVNVPPALYEKVVSAFATRQGLR